MATVTPSLEQTGTGLLRAARLIAWNLSRAMIITRREVIDMLRDWRIIFPILILTGLFPFIANSGAARMLRWASQYDATIVAERLIPFLLLVVGFFPSSFSLIIALESFVGEKERQSIEPLLASPMSNLQLYMGKMLSATVPPLIGSLMGITVYLVSLYFNVQYVPPLNLLVLVIVLTSTQATVMVAGAVVVSSQTTSVRAANLLASFIILPMAFLIQAEAFVLFWGNYGVLWWFVVGLWALGVLLIRMGVQVFNREELLGREMDDLNLLVAGKNLIVKAIARRPQAPRRSAWRWMVEEIFVPTAGLWKELAVIMIAMIAGYLIGRSYIAQYPIPGDLFYTEDFSTRFQAVLIETGFHGIRGVLAVLGQNMRVLALASILAVISFGVLAALILMLPIGVIGFLAPQMVMAGLDPAVAWAAVVPHSLFEVPAVILAGAVAMKVGTSVIAPPPGKTVGQAWSEALALAVRLWWVVILPLLLAGAIVEIYVTPSLVAWFVGGG